MSIKIKKNKKIYKNRKKCGKNTNEKGNTMNKILVFFICVVYDYYCERYARKNTEIIRDVIYIFFNYGEDERIC